MVQAGRESGKLLGRIFIVFDSFPMTKLRVFAVLAAGLLAACAGKPGAERAEEAPEDNEGALFSTTRDYNRPALEIPPDLLQSAGEKVRDNAAAAVAGGGAAGAGAEQVLPPVTGASIQSGDGKSWLEIDAEAETVWKKLTEFWALQEIDLADYRPQAGIMATDWFARKSDRGGGKQLSAIAAELFDALVSRRTAVDKFTLRLERDENAGEARTRIFVTHRAREKVARELDDLDKTVEFEWVERDEDPEKIAQLLQTIVLLFDAGAGESDEESVDNSADNSAEGSAEESAEPGDDESAEDSGEAPA